MNETIINSIAKSLKVSVEQVKNTLSLLEEGNTVPFIARYRKEATKGLDEEQILYIEKQYQYEQNLADRKEAVLKLISEQGKLTEEITNAINACTKLSQVEDLYKPYKQKKSLFAYSYLSNLQFKKFIRILPNCSSKGCSISSSIVCIKCLLYAA